MTTSHRHLAVITLATLAVILLAAALLSDCSQTMPEPSGPDNVTITPLPDDHDSEGREVRPSEKPSSSDETSPAEKPTSADETSPTIQPEKSRQVKDEPSNVAPQANQQVAKNPLPSITPSGTKPSVPSAPTEPSKPTKPSVPNDPAKPSDPSVPTKPSDPTKPNVPSDPSKPSDPTEPSVPSEPDKPSDPTEPSKPSDPTEPSKPSDPTEPEQPKDPIKIDTSNITVSAQTFAYDGQPHFPELSNLPEGVTPKIVLADAQKTNAGPYSYRVEFETAEGYTADPFEVLFTIEPAKVTCEYVYDPTTNLVSVNYEGLVENDIAKIEYSTNDDPASTDRPALTNYGFYTVGSEITLKSGKSDNYELPSAAETTQKFEVKRKNTWLDLKLAARDTGDKIIVDVSIKNAQKVPYYPTCNMPIIQFNLYFDENQIEYDLDSLENKGVDADGNLVQDYITNDANAYHATWTAEANATFEHVYYENDGSIRESARDVIVNLNTNMDEGKVDANDVPLYDDDTAQSIGDNSFTPGEEYKICQLTFIPKADAKNIVIRAGEINYTGGNDEHYPFEFTANDAEIVVRSNADAKPVEVIEKDNNITDDANYVGGGNDIWFDPDSDDDKTIAEGNLQAWIDNDFAAPDTLEEPGTSSPTTFSVETTEPEITLEIIEPETQAESVAVEETVETESADIASETITE